MLGMSVKLFLEAARDRAVFLSLFSKVVFNLLRKTMSFHPGEKVLGNPPLTGLKTLPSPHTVILYSSKASKIFHNMEN